ncbi:MAG TPA: IclR family transcriptional regulator [Rhodoblastus sp.]|nr:IclR family transcriptional regulator [Rhodoblastus sp.]
MATESRGVQSIEVGGRILSALASSGRPLMLRDVAALAEVAPAQAHAYLVSFRKIGLVEQDAQSGLYRVGPFALQLGLARLRAVDALRLAGAAVPGFADEINLMVTVTVWGSFGPTIVQVLEGTRQVHVNLRAGAVYSLTGTATGVVFGAFLPKATVQSHIDGVRGEDHTGRIGAEVDDAAFGQAIVEVRRRGYAVAKGSPIPGVNALSAPVFDHNGQLQLVVTVIGPAVSVDIAPESALARRLLAFTGGLSRQLGYDVQTDGSPFLRDVKA